MPNFIARVELHSASEIDYEDLHLYMQQNLYSRTVQSDERKTYQLPTGTYVSRSGYSSAGAALQGAVLAASATGRTFSIIVADWNSAQWQGLPVSNGRAA